MRSNRWITLTLVVGAALGLALAGGEVRSRLGIEFTLEGLTAVRDWVRELGPTGVAAFVGIVAFRTFLLVPSALVLVLGGIVYGAIGGALLGGLGVTLSSAYQFGSARLMGDDWIRPRMGPRGRALEERVRRLGPAVVFVGTAHPVGPLTPVNLAAGLASMPLRGFVLAAVPGAAVRASIYGLLGTSMLSWGTGSLVVASAIALAAVAPFAHPGFRRWIYGSPAAPDGPLT